jgi:hypothetical protein
MSKFQASIFFCILITIILFACNSNPYHKQQQALAEQLGVKIEDYPYPRIFPHYYFSEILRTGMSPKEVHNIVKGYDEIFVCGDYKEIYYYFSRNDDKALRLQIFYDNDHKYVSLQGEDDNSRYIKTEDCIYGGMIGE